MAVKDIKGEILEAEDSISYGYLLCPNCQGYYQLKNGESPEDFESCECGSRLEYLETLPKVINKTYDDDDMVNNNIYDDYTEIEQILTILKSKSQKRKELLKTLSNRIEIQEGLLSEIKAERWNLWDVLNQRNLQSDIQNQKRLLDDIVENEDRLMMAIKEQRERAHSSENKALTHYIQKIGTRGFLILEFVIIMVLLVFLFI